MSHSTQASKGLLTVACRIIEQSFEITELEQAFYAKMGVPFPTLCPEERARRRLAWRNERKFYQRKCDFSGKEIISVYSPNKPYTVYAQDIWWSDQWNPLSYGRDFDFSRSFFEQWNELFMQVPKVALLSRNSENCDYTNICAFNKNCYILVESSNNEDCHYGYWMQESRDCIDCAFCSQCELCYEVRDSDECYNLQYSENCKGCRDSFFLKDCSGCKNCFACVNLVQKQYCIFNTQYSKKEYEEKLKEMNMGSYVFVQDMIEKVQEFYLQYPHKYTVIINSENCTGCYISHSQRCDHCYHVNDAQDCKYAVHVWRNSKDNMDVDTVGLGAELNYECINTAIDAFHNMFCMRCWTVNDLFYCDNCDYTKNCFGSCGLRKKQYCILNKQYTKEEYESLVPRIIEHMKEAKEWGEFFPAKYSPFGYNETVAMEYYPMNEVEVEQRGGKWYTKDYTSQYQGVYYDIPDDIYDVSDDITKAILQCEYNRKPFKIITQELIFYQRLGIPIPRKSPEKRHLERIARRLPRKLYHRKCGKTGIDILTPYAPERPEIVYSEEAYQEYVFS